MNSEDNTVVEAIAELARAGQTPLTSTREDGTKFALFPDHTCVDLTPAVPARKSAQVELDDVASFVAYVTKHETQGTLVALRWDKTSGTLIADATLDHHGVVLAGWKAHRCQARLQATAGWTAWLGSNRTSMSQLEFAKFLEDRLVEVTSPDAATLLDIVTTLEATQDVVFKSGVRLHNGDREFHYRCTTEAKAGEEGSLVIPKLFHIEITPYYGGAAIPVVARLKYRIGQQGLAVWYELESVEDLMANLLQAVRESLAATLPTVLVVLGKTN